MSTTGRAERPRRRFRPTLWSAVAAAPVLAALVGLGTWQVHRLEWKEAIIAERAAQLAAPPVAVGRGMGTGPDLAFRRAAATGRFLHSRAFRIVNRTHRGRAGFDIVTPFRLGLGDHLLVNRGWVPAHRPVPAAGRDGPTTVTGILRRPEKTSRWVPDNDPAGGVWYYADPAAMASVAGLAGVRGLVLVADAATGPGDFPIARKAAVEIRNRHLEYAMTWYGLALVLAVIYVLFHWRREGTAR